jgi:hypothetical protein
VSTRFSKPLTKSETISIKVGNTSAVEHRFADTDNLIKGKKVTGIMLHTEALVLSRNQNQVVPNAIQKQGFLVLAFDGKEPIRRLPLEVFFNTANTTEEIPLANIEIDLTKSYVEINQASGIAQNNEFVFTFFYQ